MKKFIKSTISFLCALAMIVSSIGITSPITAYAEGEDRDTYEYTFSSSGSITDNTYQIEINSTSGANAVLIEGADRKNGSASIDGMTISVKASWSFNLVTDKVD